MYSHLDYAMEHSLKLRLSETSHSVKKKPWEVPNTHSFKPGCDVLGGENANPQGHCYENQDSQGWGYFLQDLMPHARSRVIGAPGEVVQQGVVGDTPVAAVGKELKRMPALPSPHLDNRPTKWRTRNGFANV